MGNDISIVFYLISGLETLYERGNLRMMYLRTQDCPGGLYYSYLICSK